MDRAVSPVVAIVLLVGITVVGAAGVASVATGLDGRVDATAAPTLAVSADADGQAITVIHRGGAALDLENHTMRIRVDGEALAHQPPVPYFAAEGFQGTPTGAFNSGGDAVLSPGDEATLRLASTNAPHVAAGDRVRVRFLSDGRRVAQASVRAG